jgi:hypothetical protein
MFVGIALFFSACGVMQVPSYDKDKAPEEGKSYSDAKQMAEQQKDQVALMKQANKLKCQDTRLDWVDAEASGDINRIQQVRSRIQKLCVVE